LEPGLTREDLLRLGGSGLGVLLLTGGASACGGGHACPDVAAGGRSSCADELAWLNYPETQRIVPEDICSPASLADLAAAVCEAESRHQRVHAFGSKWAFSDCAITPARMIDTRLLNRELGTVKAALRPGQPDDVYHVEAGITIRDLYENLARQNVALVTMGGASGQTLAGAVSTGTHGGDKSMPPLADNVLALHVIGTGGVEYWIEPSRGITEQARLRRYVVPTIDRHNIIYDDATFDACLVSMGCLGVIYAVVLKVRQPYDLVETTIPTTWSAFKANAQKYLSSSQQRFLQVLVSPYPNDKNENYCLLTRRFEAPAAGPNTRPDRGSALGHVFAAMLATMPQPETLVVLKAAGVIDAIFDPNLSPEDKLAAFVRAILERIPDQRTTLVKFYSALLASAFPPGAFRGASYSVMDIGYGGPIPPSQPGHSFELSFDAAEEDGRRPVLEYIDRVIDATHKATNTYLAGYISLRFTGRTRASLGMQQWDQTGSVEISTVRNVPQLDDELLPNLYRIGFDAGALAHWGQELRQGGAASRYPRYGEWRRVYARMSDNFKKRTFENPLALRWQLTTPP
jgi:FAD/FMN-containing dehydrogenase